MTSSLVTSVTHWKVEVRASSAKSDAFCPAASPLVAPAPSMGHPLPPLGSISKVYDCLSLRLFSASLLCISSLSSPVLFLCVYSLSALTVPSPSTVSLKEPTLVASAARIEGTDCKLKASVQATRHRHVWCAASARAQHGELDPR
ncbi:hypothetical protein EI94DRAFT_1800425 [Lactarius quietus]|nr:hypothetical protein EI94DRAFT_1800425 [Lactarius quietus]